MSPTGTQAGLRGSNNPKSLIVFESRHRHLQNDLVAMLPHGRKDVKFDSKSKLYQLNELAELYNCNNVLFFEARKGMDLYMWLSKAGIGPTVKFHLQNCENHDPLWPCAFD